MSTFGKFPLNSETRVKVSVRDVLHFMVLEEVYRITFPFEGVG